MNNAVILIVIMNVFGIMSTSILVLPQHASASVHLEESFGKSTVAVTGRHVYVAEQQQIY